MAFLATRFVSPMQENVERTVSEKPAQTTKMKIIPKRILIHIITKYIIGPARCQSGLGHSSTEMCDCILERQQKFEPPLIFVADCYMGPIFDQERDDDFDFFNTLVDWYHRSVLQSPKITSITKSLPPIPKKYKPLPLPPTK